MKEHSKRPYQVYEADADAEYDEEYTIDLSTLKSTVSFPHLPENTHTIDEVGDIRIDQVVIGSCTNGRLEDLKTAAEILKGKKVAKGLRVIVIPATQQIYLDAMAAGYIRTFIEAGAVVSTPTSALIAIGACSLSLPDVRWTMPWRIHGNPCGRGTLCIHHKP